MIYTILILIILFQSLVIYFAYLLYEKQRNEIIFWNERCISLENQIINDYSEGE